MAIDDRLSDLLVDWEQSQRDGRETTPEELCKDAPDLLPVVRESIDSLKATRWMFAPDPSEPNDAPSHDALRAALHDTELPASHLTVEQFAASIFQSGLLSSAEIAELNQRLAASDLPGEAREIASRLVTEGKLTRYQASVLLKASKDPLLVDNYVILDTLDTGGMGLVFKALHRSMNRVVALKLLPAAMMSARDTVKRFQREVQAAASLSHPNIVAAYDADESAEVAYLVLEYVEGTNLFRLVKEHGPLPVARACNYVRQAATGLAYLHSRGIIHRDVKPANLILANDGTVKLLDMGLVRFASSEDLSSVETDQELTQAGIVIGTVAYMSPEQALDTRSADQRSDIYSLGCTLFFLLTGRSLYPEETGMKTLLAHREQAVPSIREFCEDAPVSLDAVFRTMVAKRPADRLQSMTEVVAALDACVPGLATNSPAAVAPRHALNVRPIPDSWRRGWKRLRSSPLRIALAIAVVAAIAAGGVYFAGTLIRIKSSKGTMDIYVDDPKASVEVTPGVTAPNGVAQFDNRHTARSTADPFDKQREIKKRQSTIQELEVENQRLRSEADAVRNRGRIVTNGFPARQPPEAGPEPLIVPLRQAPSVDRQVAQWLFSFPGTLIWLHGEVQAPLQSMRQFPEGDARIEGIFCRRLARPIRYSEQDVERLAALSELRWLSIDSPTVTDAFVVRLKPLKALRGLTLEGAKITDECLPALAGMTHLSSLNLSGAQEITDAGLTHLAALKSLNAPNPAAEGGSSELPPWLRMEIARRPRPSLVLDNTRTTEAGLLKLQQALPNCAIYASHIYPGSSVAGLPLPPRVGSSDRDWAIWILSHYMNGRIYTDLDSDTAVFKPQDLPPIEFHIERIGFGATDFVVPVLNEFLFRRFAELSHLRALQIDQKVPGRELSGLAAIKSLRSLGLGDGSAGDDSLRPLAALTGLTTLTVQGSDITDEGLKSLAPLKGLAQLVLDGRARNLRGTGFEALVGNTALRGLDLTGAGIEDDGARQIARLTGLESLNLAETWIGGTGLAELSKLKHLKSLNLRFCRRLRSADLAPLVKLPALEDLRLTACRINDAAVDTLKKLTNLRTLNVDGTGMSADAIGGLQRTLPRHSGTAGPAGQTQVNPTIRLPQSGLGRASSDAGAQTRQIPGAGPESFVVPRPRPSVPSVDRQVAQWLLSFPGTLIFLQREPARPIQSIEQFPAGNRPIEAIFVGVPQKIPIRYQDADVDRLASLSELKWLSLESATVNDAFIVRLKGLKGLEGLSLAGANVTDECLPALAEMTHLSSLDLSGCGGITDAGLKHLAVLKSLNDANRSIHRGDIKNWLRLRRSGRPLPSLVLDNTQTTEAGLLKLQKFLPTCAIYASHIYPGVGLTNLPLPPEPGSSDRAWAEWILRHFPRCKASTDVDPGRVFARIQDLPPTEFHIERISFGPTDSGEYGSGLDAFLFRRFGDLSHLRGLQIDRKVMARDLGGLAAIKSLQMLELGAGNVGDDSLQPLAAITGLKALIVRGTDITDQGLKSLAPLKELTQLMLDGHAHNLNGKGFQALVGITTLRNLNLSGAGINDDGVRHIAQLAGLEKLDLSETVISGKGLAELSRLKHLKSLNLRFCRALRSADLAPLVELPALEDLSLADCRINDEAADTLKKLTKLRTLNVDRTGMSSDVIRELQRTIPRTRVSPAGVQIQATPGGPGKNSAHFDNSQVRSPARPAAIVGKTENEISDRRELFGNSRTRGPKPGSSDVDWATWLLNANPQEFTCQVFVDVDPKLTITRTSDLPPINFHIQKLRFGQPGDSKGLPITASFFERLADLTQLQTLQMYGEVRTKELRGLVALKSLHALAIHDASAGDDALGAICAMTHLEKLVFDSGAITDGGLKSLGSLKELTELSLPGCARNLHGTGFEALRDITTLRMLRVAGSGIDDDGAKQIGKLVTLEQLDLAHTWISVKGLADLAGLTNLKLLNLSRCQRLRATDMAPLAGISSLEVVSLNGCRIGDRAVDALKKLPKLKFLQLDNTDVTPAAIRMLRDTLRQARVVSPALAN